MAKTGRSLSNAEVPLPRNRLIPLLVAVVVILAIRYLSQQGAPPEANPQAQNAPTVEVEGTKPPVAEASTTKEAQVTARPKPAATSKPSATSNAATNTAGDSSLVIRNLSLKDQDGNVVYRGDIDLRPTVERIVAGRKLRFSHDGSTFQNREGRLPSRPSGYYREWVVPTPGEDGPGPQRIVTGDYVDAKPGEFWYTADHYRTFRRISGQAHSPAPTELRKER